MASEKISLIVVSESRERLQMAAMIASVGAVSGHPVTVFLSMNALPYFARSNELDAPAEGNVGTLLKDRNAPPFLELFQQAVELGDAEICPCSMAMDVLDLRKDDLLPFVGEPLGLTRFLDDASGGQYWTF